MLCSMSVAALAAEPMTEADTVSTMISAADTLPSVSAYPAEVRASEENGVYRLEKVYYLTAKDDPATIPTADFEREGRTYTLLDLLKNDQTETDTREHIEVVTLESKTKDMAEILKLLEPKLEVKTEDGYEGVLSLDHTTIQVEAAGYGTSSRTVTAERTYPNLSDADVSLVPKSVNENGRTLTLADVSWQEAAVDPTDGYVCEEISAPDGYVITDATETVYLSGKDQDVITVTFGNDKMGSLLIVKKDAVTGAPISDVEFFITDSDGSVIGNANGKYVTDSAGTIRIDGLTPGMTVIAKEVRAKDGYILDDTPQSIKIKRNSVMTLEFRNQPRGGVLVKKVDAVTNAPISDVEFLVTDSDGNLIGNANGKYVTDSAGTFTITDIAPGTTLIIKEASAREGYVLDDTPQTVKVKSNEVTTLEFRNQPKGNLIIVKQDSITKEPLEGVEFKITYADGSYVDAEGGTLSSTGLYWTDKEGKITISGISGTVVVTEIETIPGYTIDENSRTQTVVVNPNDTQTLYFVRFVP